MIKLKNRIVRLTAEIANTQEASEQWVTMAHYGVRNRIGSRTVPALHMPRWASRLTLMVEAVKIERLQDITEEEAVAEGCLGGDLTTARIDFELLWISLRDQGSWNENPEVVAISFRVLRQNIGKVV